MRCWSSGSAQTASSRTSEVRGVQRRGCAGQAGTEAVTSRTRSWRRSSHATASAPRCRSSWASHRRPLRTRQLPSSTTTPQASVSTIRRRSRPSVGIQGRTLGQQRLNVFQRAADIWAAELDSPIAITVLASMEPLACTATTATLGSAGVRFIISDFAGVGLFPGAEFPNTWYGTPLASKRSGVNVLGDIPRPSPARRPRTSGPGSTRRSASPDLSHRQLLVLRVRYQPGAGTEQPAGGAAPRDSATGSASSSSPASRPVRRSGGLGDIYGQYLLDTTAGLTWNQMTNAQRAASAINSRRLVWNGAEVTSDVPSVMRPGRPRCGCLSPAGIAGTYDIGTAPSGRAVVSGRHGRRRARHLTRPTPPARRRRMAARR